MRTPVPPNVFLILDHLDSVLASAEELSQLSIILLSQPKSDGATPPGANLKPFVDRARMLELSIMSRALQARARARELRNPHSHIKPLLSLFIGGLAPLEDAVADLGDTSSAQFETGNCPLAYLRSRGVLPPDCGSLQGLMQLAIGDEFLVAQRIALGPLMELAAGMLDTLMVCYDLARDANLLPLSEERERSVPSDAETHITRA
jgi:hypothetical protein